MASPIPDNSLPIQNDVDFQKMGDEQGDGDRDSGECRQTDKLDKLMLEKGVDI